MLSFFLRFIFLNFLFIFFVSLELSASKNEWLKFTDNDSRGGWISGDMEVTIPNDLSWKGINNSNLKFALYWGNNPYQRLGMFLPIVKFPMKKTGGKIKITFKVTKVPPGATHIILFLIDEKDKSEKDYFSLPFFDKGVPESKPQGIIFEQIAKKGNSIKGRIILSRAWDERNLSHYAVYWGTGPRTVLRSKPPLKIIKKRSWFESLLTQIRSPWSESDIIEEVEVLMPNEATHLIAFSRNEEGQMNVGVSFELESIKLKKNISKNKLILDRTHSPIGIISGEVILNRKKIESGSHDYLFFWGEDDKKRLSDLPPITKFEIKKIRDGLIEKEILVSSKSMMDQKLQVTSIKDGSRVLKYKFPSNTFVPQNAKYILAYKQQKFWFESDVERKLEGPIGSVSLDDPEGTKNKIKIKKKLKTELKDFSITKFKNKKDLKKDDSNIDSKSYNETKNTAPDWRVSEYRGLGLGFSFSGLNGISVFYDYNLDNNRQFHFELDLTGPQVASVFKTLRLTNEGSDMESVGKSLSGNSLEINRTLFSTIYRWFVDESLVWGISEGFFYGAGAGFGYSTLQYRGRDSTASAIISGENETFNSTTTDYSHSTTGMGLFALLDAGWQGLKNYYFQISIQPSVYILYSDGFDEESIPVNPGQRSIVKDRWTKSKNPSRIILGFGVFF